MKLLVFISLLWLSYAAATEYYTAGAVQFMPYGTAQEDPADVIGRNLREYWNFVKEASEQGVQILVFSECGLGNCLAHEKNTREAMYHFCESIPDPRDSTAPIIPCDNPTFAGRPQLQNVSCMAQTYKMTLVLNTCDVEYCTTTTHDCPADGKFQYNAHAVFDETGRLVARYRKVHLFGENKVFNHAKSEPITFKTAFGVTFGAIICFDLQYLTPVRALIDMGIRNFVFSTWWWSQPPAMVATQVQQGFSRINKVNLIAANTGAAPINNGGGLWSEGRPVNVEYHTVGPDNQINNIRKLLVAKLPILPDGPFVASETHIPLALPSLGSAQIAPVPAAAAWHGKCSIGAIYGPWGNCVMLHAKNAPQTGSLTVSDGPITCNLDYKIANNPNEDFALFVYKGTQNIPNTPEPFNLEICTLVHCEHHSILPDLVAYCRPVYESKTIFSEFKLHATGFNETGNLMPLFALNQAQVQPIESLGYKDEYVNGQRTATLTSNVVFDQPLFSAAAYSVIPNPDF